MTKAEENLKAIEIEIEKLFEHKPTKKLLEENKNNKLLIRVLKAGIKQLKLVIPVEETISIYDMILTLQEEIYKNELEMQKRKLLGEK